MNGNKPAGLTNVVSWATDEKFGCYAVLSGFSCLVSSLEQLVLMHTDKHVFSGFLLTFQLQDTPTGNCTEVSVVFAIGVHSHPDKITPEENPGGQWCGYILQVSWCFINDKKLDSCVYLNKNCFAGVVLHFLLSNTKKMLKCECDDSFMIVLVTDALQYDYSSMQIKVSCFGSV